MQNIHTNNERLVMALYGVPKVYSWTAVNECTKSVTCVLITLLYIRLAAISSNRERTNKYKERAAWLKHNKLVMNLKQGKQNNYLE